MNLNYEVNSWEDIELVTFCCGWCIVGLFYILGVFDFIFLGKYILIFYIMLEGDGGEEVFL